MSVRAKLCLTSVTTQCWNPNSKKLHFDTQYDDSIPEDQRFYDATPSGNFEMLVNNPAALAQFELGKMYYVDVTPAA